MFTSYISPTGSGVIGAVDSWGESPEQPRLVPAKVGRFLGMVMMIMSLKQKKIKFRPRIKLDHNFSMERWGGGGIRIMLLSLKKLF